jgi:hypothetical protein
MNDQRRAQIKKASYELTKSRERPFSFYERDKEHKPPSSQKVEKFVFRANPIPASTSEPRYAQIQGEDHLRKQRINRMSQELLKEAKLPPRMERYEKGPGREKERQRKLREKAQPRGCTFKPQINPHIPEFERLQSEFEMLMARRKKEATGSQTFQSEEHLKRAPWAGEGTNDNPQGLRTESKDPKKVLNKVKKDIAMDAIILPEERWPFMSTRCVSLLPAHAGPCGFLLFRFYSYPCHFIILSQGKAHSATSTRVHSCGPPHFNKKHRVAECGG